MTNLQEEIWIPIPNYEGKYEVSNLGRVRSLPRYVYREICKSNILIKGGILKSILNQGYTAVTLYGKNKEKRPTQIHKLVFFSFNPDVKKIKGYEVDHIDNDRSNAKLSNLQYIKTRHNSSKRSMNLKKTSRFTGVSWDKEKSKWQTHIRANGKSYYLGRYDSEIEAANIYNNALKEIEQGIFHKEIHIPSSGYKGVYWHKDAKKWTASYKGTNLGVYIIEKDAALAYENATKGIFPPKRILTSKYKGVSFNKQQNRWIAGLNGKYIGIFATEEQAYQARENALKQSKAA